MSLMKDLLSLRQSEVVTAEAYDMSSDFDADMSQVDDLLGKARDIMVSKDWTRHLKDTDDNFSTSAVEYNRRALEKLEWTIKAVQELYQHIIDEAQ